MTGYYIFLIWKIMNKYLKIQFFRLQFIVPATTLILLSNCANNTSTTSASGSTTGSTTGTTNKRIFITQTAYTGNLGGIAGADTKCAIDANNPGGTFKALIVDGTNRVATTGSQTGWVLATTKSYYTLGWSLIGTTDVNGLFTTTNLANAVTTAAASAWTGLTTTWTTSANTCTGWTLTTGNGDAGTTNTINVANFISNGMTNACTSTFRLICVEQ